MTSLDSNKSSQSLSTFDVLRRIPAFKDLSDEEIILLEQHSTRRLFRVGETTGRQGEPAYRILILASGMIQLFFSGIHIDISLGEGEFYGEVGFFIGESSATAITTLDTDIIILSYIEINRLMDIYPQLGFKLQKAFALEAAKKLRFLTARFFSKVLDNSSKQLAHDLQAPLAALKAMKKKEADAVDVTPLTLILERLENVTASYLKKDQTKNALYPTQEWISVDHLDALINSLLLEKRVFAETAPGKEISFFYLPESLPRSCKLTGSGIELQRILSNLLDNSIDAIAARGTIHVRVYQVDSESVKIEVHDTGHGISADLLSRLGSEVVSMKKENGHGLGLIYASRKLKEWGGHLTIHSDSISQSSVGVFLRVDDGGTSLQG